MARYVTRDVEVHGRTVPEGSATMMLIGAANWEVNRMPRRQAAGAVGESVPGRAASGSGFHGSALRAAPRRFRTTAVIRRCPEPDAAAR